MQALRLNVNGDDREVEVYPDHPLLWVLRDSLGLTGPKYACGIARCGACLVHVDGVAVPSCVTPVRSVVGRRVVTIEGLGGRSGRLLRQAWKEAQVSQCGFCQPGQIMAAAALLDRVPDPTEAEINAAMSPVLCRCGSYPRIRRAIHQASRLLRAEDTSDARSDR